MIRHNPLNSYIWKVISKSTLGLLKVNAKYKLSYYFWNVNVKSTLNCKFGKVNARCTISCDIQNLIVKIKIIKIN